MEQASKAEAKRQKQFEKNVAAFWDSPAGRARLAPTPPVNEARSNDAPGLAGPRGRVRALGRGGPGSGLMAQVQTSLIPTHG